ncbi:MAG: hypothetical protein ACXABV_17365 [Candidatus Thorarchaeota archaeon]|jgi:hypothetical protein
MTEGTGCIAAQTPDSESLCAWCEVKEGLLLNGIVACGRHVAVDQRLERTIDVDSSATGSRFALVNHASMRACQTTNALPFFSLEENLADYSRVELIHLNMLQIDLPVFNMTDGYYSSASHPMEHFPTVHYILTIRCSTRIKMNKSAKLYMVVGVAMAVTATLLMIDGQFLGEMTTDLSRILLITALPVIVKGRKSKAATNTQIVTA